MARNWDDCTLPMYEFGEGPMVVECIDQQDQEYASYNEMDEEFREDDGGSSTASEVASLEDDFVDPGLCKAEYDRCVQKIHERFERSRYKATAMPFEGEVLLFEPYLPE